MSSTRLTEMRSQTFFGSPDISRPDHIPAKAPGPLSIIERK